MSITRQASYSDALWVAMNLRMEDWNEVLTVDPCADVVSRVLHGALEVSSEARVFVLSDSAMPVALFGHLPDDNFGTEYGIIWLLATDRIKGRSLSLIKAVTPILDEWTSRYPKGLHNIVDCRNEAHLRWCALLGFTLGPITELNGHPFQYIHRALGAKPLV